MRFSPFYNPEIPKSITDSAKITVATLEKKYDTLFGGDKMMYEPTNIINTTSADKPHVDKPSE